jgi:hypothetical protein
MHGFQPANENIYPIPIAPRRLTERRAYGADDRPAGSLCGTDTHLIRRSPEPVNPAFEMNEVTRSSDRKGNPHRQGISSFGYLGLAMPHKFEVGQTVQLQLHSAAWEHAPTPATYMVTQQLPERDGVFEYAVTSPTEPYDRVAIESELSAT